MPKKDIDLKESILSVVNPIIDRFASDMLKIKENLLYEEEKLSVILKKEEEKLETLKVQERENIISLEEAKEELKPREENLKNLSKNLQGEISKYNKLQNDLLRKNEKIDSTLKDAEAQKELVLKALDRATKKENDYTQKAMLLKKDFDMIEAKKNKLDQLESDLSRKEGAQNKKEEELVIREQNASDKQLKLDVKEKEVYRLIERNKLEKFIKGK